MSNALFRLAFESGVKALIGYGTASFFKANKKLCAITLAIQPIVRFIFAKANGFFFKKEFKITLMTDITTYISHLFAIAVLQNANQISLRNAGVFGFFATAYLLSSRYNYSKAPSL